MAGTLDYETTNHYSLTISVNDGTGNVTTGNVTVNVTDVDETTPPDNTPAGGGGSGGCSLKSGEQFDPLLPLLLLIGGAYLWHRKRVGC